MGRRGRVAWTFLAAALIACGSSTFEANQTDGGDGGDSSDSSDASASDASGGDAGAQDGSDDSGNVPGNLVQDFGFEDGTSVGGCGPKWVNGNPETTISISTTARTGSFSCMMCAIDNTYGYLQTNPLAAPIENPPGGTYTAIAYMMAVSPDGGLPAPQGQIQLTDIFADGGAEDPTGNASAINSSTWTPVALNAALDPGKSLVVNVITIPSGSAAPACALVDDVSVVVH